MRVVLLLILIPLSFINLAAQKYEWVKFYQGQSTQQLSSLSSDDNGNVYFTINFVKEIKFDTTTLAGASGVYRAFMCKKNTSGQTLWYKVARAINDNYTLFALGSTFTNSGNQLVFVRGNSDIIFGTDTIRRTSNSTYTFFILEINPSGKLIRGKEFLNGDFANQYYISKNFTHDANDNIYISLQCSGPVTVIDTITSTVVGSNSGNYIFKFSNAGKVLKWGRTLPSNIVTNNIDADIHGNVYIGSFWENSPSSFTFNSQTINRPQTTSGCAFVLDKNGGDKNWFNILASGGESTVAGIAAEDSTSVYVTGYFKGDSAKFQNIWKKGKGFGAYHFFARYTTSGKLLWEKHEDTTMTVNYQKHSDYASVSSFKDQYLYISHFTNNYSGPIYYDHQRYQAPNINWGMNLKVDEYGNILWGFRTFYPFSGMGTDLQNNLYFGGYFENDSVFFGPFKAKGNAGDAFVGKTFDYAIFRGKVSSGPYCAGDTFKIPYTKLGTYADTNTFFAELSDEYGNFTGNERILGKLKTKDSGTILGVLPMFQVASSQKYRIRIRSTSPQAQSFYKIDTLRLLIYSRDKADPGKDVTICRGDTITLKTYGGTKWAWSPKFRMMDSTLHETLAWPDKTTRYRIIISDSSGCGQADTAFKTIIVRKDPKITFQTGKDTTACIGSKFQVIANYSQGDSLHYRSIWYSISKTGTFTVLKEGNAGKSDTLIFSLPKTLKDSQQLILYLTDDCSPKTDFAFYTIKVNQKKPDVVLKTHDTALCPGVILRIVAGFNNGFAPGYNWKWMEKDISNNWQNIGSGSGKTNDTLSYFFPLNWNRTRKKLVEVVLNDGCSPFADTALLTITQRDTISLALNANNKLLCRGERFVWKAQGTGGYTPGYHFTWTNASSGAVLSLSDSFVCIADTTIKVHLVLTDSCMPKAVYSDFNVNVRPPLTLKLYSNGKDAKDTTLCYGSTMSLAAIAGGGKGTGYLYDWHVNHQFFSSNDSIEINSEQVLSRNGGTVPVVITMSDQCTTPVDSADILLNVLPAISVSATGPDTICYGQQAILKVVANGGNGNYQYRWFNPANQLQGVFDTLVINHTDINFSGRLGRIAVVSDGCSKENDTTSINIELLRGLLLKLSPSDTCPLVNCYLTPSVSGGKAQNYSINWWRDNNSLGTSASSKKLVAPLAPASRFKAVLNDGCSISSDTVFALIGLKPVLKLLVEGRCLGDTTVLRVQASPKGRYQWSIDGQGMNVNDSFIKLVFPSASRYSIASVVSTDYCSSKDSVVVNILKKPLADFTYFRLNDLGSGIPFRFTDLSSDANTWHWSFGTSGVSTSEHPEFSFPDTGRIKIRLVVSNSNVCFDSIEKFIPVYDKIVFYFPNAFSPNGNSINDGFGLDPGQYAWVKTYHLEIFNRWGGKIFQTDDVKERWQTDAIDKRKLQMGVYLFKAVIEDIYGEKTELSGALEVLK